MKIAFFSDARFNGKVDSKLPNMRVDLAWIHLLDADHYYMYDLPHQMPSYDIGIIIIPKSRVDIPLTKIKQSCWKVTTMQEGPCNYWEDYTLYDQIQYLTVLAEMDFILCHNARDIAYYEGLLNKRVYVMPTVLVESLVDNSVTRLPAEKRKHAIIGGNMCGWYGGMISYIIAKRYSDKVFAPSMGRMVPGENKMEGLVHLPYMPWINWMQALNEFSVGVHIMPTVAAGTFSLNCAYLGIPCIGNIDVDTQRYCFRPLSFPVTNVLDFKNAIDSLKTDPDLYKHMAEESITIYHESFHSDVFKRKMNEIFTNELDQK